MTMTIEEALVLAWKLYCRRSGDWHSWGIVPEEAFWAERELAWVLDEDGEKEISFVSPEERLDRGTALSDGPDLLICPLSWPPFRIWAGAALILLADCDRNVGMIRRGEKTLLLFVTPGFLEKLEKMRHGEDEIRLPDPHKCVRCPHDPWCPEYLFEI
jgi:hypothetical protein